MRRTKINVDLSLFPADFHGLLAETTVYDSSCSPEARVYYLEREDGFYLKTAPRKSLEREAILTRYFYGKGLGAEVLDYLCADSGDWLLVRRVAGEDCTHRTYLDDPRRLCDLIAKRLRALHEIDCADCPIKDHVANYLNTAEQNYLAGQFDLSYCGAPDAETAWQFLKANKDQFHADTLLHGDYCLPNIMLDDWRFSGFIDLGNGGVGDRHVDLFWGAWSLKFNLGTDDYQERFFDAYGRDRIETEMLRVVAAAETFG